MRGLILALVFLAGCVSIEVRRDGDVVSEMRAVEAARGVAIREGDIAALRRIYAEDFSGIAGNGSVVTRDQLFAVFERSRGSLGQVTSEIVSARREGDIAFATGRLNVNGNESQYLHVFRWTGDHWEMITGAAVPARN